MGERRPLRVGFWLGDVTAEHGGVAPYAQRVLDALLADVVEDWQFVLLCATQAPESIRRLVAASPHAPVISLIPQPSSSSIQQPTAARGLRGKLNVWSKRREASPPPRWYYLEEWIDSLSLDLLHFPTQTILHEDLQTAYSVTMRKVRELPHLNLRVPYVVTMHDVQELHFPEYFTPFQRAIRAVHYWKSMEKAGKVIVSFDHVKADLIKYFNLDENKVHVCPIPFNSISLQEPTPEASRRYGEKYERWTPYLLYPSHTWQHKNHLQLFRALRKLHDAFGKELKLICTGGINHHYHRQVVSQVEATGLHERVLFTDIVPEDELTWLYRNTALVAIPTSYEAGSFPLFEAIKLGVPVICSDVTSLPDTIGDPRFVFDPRSVEELSDLILRMLTDDGFRQENIINSARQADKLGRVNAASYFRETYRSLLESTS